jgi:hypothetical protein
MKGSILIAFLANAKATRENKPTCTSIEIIPPIKLQFKFWKNLYSLFSRTFLIAL